ncbi:hypothetical protein NC652_016761 [Populus alba x Populus x berolinensis]|nr:hypothetical protein NC652_016761 [Populus alba x Populus x berolinensis]KAJ6923215.1 hypothetical protein NC652_016761 [Populus alba x Populus x berolinensis]
MMELDSASITSTLCSHPLTWLVQQQKCTSCEPCQSEEKQYPWMKFFCEGKNKLTEVRLEKLFISLPPTELMT